MFEQTLLTHPASARKTSALAAFLLAQMTILGVLLVGPLLYTQALPVIPVIYADVFAPPPPPPPPPPQQPMRTANSNSSLAGPVRGVFVPPRFVPTGPIRTLQVEVSMDFPVEITISPGVPGGVATSSTALPVFAAASAVEVAKTAVTRSAASGKPLVVSGGVLASKLLKQVMPAYPTVARQARIAGAVHLIGIIAKDGRVRDLKVLDGHPMLRAAALQAVSQWIYSPTYLNGQPVEVEAPIEVNFRLD